MNRSYFKAGLQSLNLKFCPAILTMFVLAVTQFVFPQGQKPNIVFVFADQMRSTELGSMGNPYIKTPYLDTMAAQGVLLQNAFVATPVCTPYRAQLMTGKYGHTNGVLYNDLRLPPEEITIAEVLKEQGYATGYIGKWHLDGGRKSSDPLEKAGYIKPENRQGWDYWAALEVTHDYEDWYYYTGTSTEKQHEAGWESDLQTTRGIEFMGWHKDSAFILMISWGPPHNWCCPADGSMPHGAYDSPPEFEGWHDPALVPIHPNVPDNQVATARNEIAGHYDMVSNLDYNMGRIMKAIDSLGLAENTIVAFSSDHGDMLRSHGRVHKQVPYEESVHVPFIIWYKDKITSGSKTDLLVNSVDIMPTLLGLADADIPPGVQGENFAPFLLGQDQNQPEAAYLSLNDNDKVGSDGGFAGNYVGVRTKEWLYAAQADGDWLMYNIKDDPYQLINLIDDPDYADIRDQLRALTLQKKEEFDDPFIIDYSGWTSQQTGCMDIDALNYDPAAVHEFPHACRYEACCDNPLYVEYKENCKNPVSNACISMGNINELEAHDQFSLIHNSRFNFQIVIPAPVTFHITIHALQGSLVHDWKGTGPVEKELKLPEKGVYFLRLATPHRVTQKKVIVF